MDIGKFGKLTSQYTNGNVMIERDQNGKKIAETVYNTNGQKMSVSYFDENENLSAKTEYTYHSSGHIREIKHSEGDKIVLSAKNLNYGGQMTDDNLIDTLTLESKVDISQIKHLADFLSIPELQVNNKSQIKLDLQDKNASGIEKELKFNYGENGLSSITFEDGRIYQLFTQDSIETFEYDSAGKLVASITDGGKVTKYEHAEVNGKDMLKTVVYDKDPDSYNTAKVISYCYNPLNKNNESEIFANDYNKAFAIYECDTAGNIISEVEFAERKSSGDERQIVSVTRYEKTERGGNFSLNNQSYKAIATEFNDNKGNIQKIQLKNGVDIADYTPPLQGTGEVELLSEDNKLIAKYQYNSNNMLEQAYMPLNEDGSDNLVLQEFLINNGSVTKITRGYNQDSDGNYKFKDMKIDSENKTIFPYSYIRYEYEKDGNGNDKIIAKAYDKEDGADKKLLYEKEYGYNASKTAARVLSEIEYNYDDSNNRVSTVTYKPSNYYQKDISSVALNNLPGLNKTSVDVVTRYNSQNKPVAIEKNTDDDDYVDSVQLITKKDGVDTGITLQDYTPPKTNKPNSNLKLTDSDGKVIAIYSYNSLGYIDMNESSTNIEYQNGKISKAIANNGKITEFDKDDNVISIHSEKEDKNDGGIESAEYDPETGNLKKITKYDDKNNVKYIQEYNEQGYPAKTTLKNEELSDYKAPASGIPGGIYKIYDAAGNVAEIILYDSDGNRINKQSAASYETDNSGNLTKYITRTGSVILFEQQDEKIKVTKYKNDPKDNPDTDVLEVTYYNSYEEMSTENAGKKEIWDCDKDGKLISKIIDSKDENVVQVSYEEVSSAVPGSVKLGGRYYVESAKTEFGSDGYPKNVVLKTDNLANFEAPPEYYAGQTLCAVDEEGNVKGYINYDKNGALYSVTDENGIIYKSSSGTVTTKFEYTKNESGVPTLKRATCSNGNVTLYETVGNTIKATKYENDPDDASKEQKILAYIEYDQNNGCETFRDTYKYDKSGNLKEVTRKTYTPDSTSKVEMEATLNQRICLEGYVRKGSERVSQITQYAEIKDGSAPEISLNGKNYKKVSVAKNTDTDDYVDEIELFGNVADYTPATFNVKNGTVKAYKDGEIVALYAYNSNGTYDKKDTAVKPNIMFDSAGNLAKSVANGGKVTEYTNGKPSKVWEDKLDQTSGAKTSRIYYNPKTGNIDSQIYYNPKTGEENCIYYFGEKNVIQKIELKKGKLEYLNPPSYNYDGSPIQVFGADGKICAEYRYKRDGGLNYKESIVNGFKFDNNGKVTGYTTIGGNESVISQDAKGNYIVTGYNNSADKGKKVLIQTYASYDDLMNKKNILKEETNKYSLVNPSKRVSNIVDIYDSAGKVKSRVIKRFDDDAKPTFTEKYEYSSLKEVQVYNSDCEDLPVTYGPRKSEVKVTNGSGTVIGSYVYDSDGTVIESKDKSGKTMQTFRRGKLENQFEYSNGRIAVIKNVKSGSVTKFDYSNNSIVAYTYSKADVEKKDYTHPVERTEYSEYKSYSERKEITRVKIEYDNAGNKKKETAYEPGQYIIAKVTEYASDGKTVNSVTDYTEGKPVSATLRNGMKLTDYNKPDTADAKQVISVSNESGSVIGKCVYSATGKISQLLNADDNIIRQYTPSGKYTEFTYNDNGKTGVFSNIKTNINLNGSVSGSEIIAPTEETLEQFKRQKIKYVEETIDNPEKYTPPIIGDADSVKVIKDKSGKIVAWEYFDSNASYSKVLSMTSVQFGNGSIPVKSVDARGYETVYKKNTDGTITATKINMYQNNRMEEAIYGSFEDIITDNYKQKTKYATDGNTVISRAENCTDSNGNTGKSVTYYVDGKRTETKTYFANTLEGPNTADTYIKYDQDGRAVYTEKYSFGSVYSVKLNNINIEDYKPQPIIAAQNVTVPIYNSTNKKIGAYVYDSNGYLASLQDGNGVTLKTYCNDRLQYTFQNGQPVNSTDGSGNKFTWAQESGGWTVTKKDSSGKWLATIKYANVNDIINHNITTAQLLSYDGGYKTVTPLDGLCYSVKEVKNNVTYTNSVEKIQYANIF